MTTEGFSNGFDVLLNEFAHSADFGKDTSIQDIRIDEYEKSVLLTKSEEDTVLELYSGRNSFGASFEETEELRRSLAKLVNTSELTPVMTPTYEVVRVEGIVHYGSANAWINAPLILKTFSKIPVRVIIRSIADSEYASSSEDIREHHSPVLTESSEEVTIEYNIPCNIQLDRYLRAIGEDERIESYVHITWPVETTEMFDQRYNENIGSGIPAVMYDITAQFIPAAREKVTDKSYLFNLPDELWRIVYESAYLDTPNGEVCANTSFSIGQGIRIVPVTHDELAVVLRNPFRGPKANRILRLDKAANQVELISIKYAVSKYLVRYLRRPKPIILLDLRSEGLKINGEDTPMTCELHESLHQKILERAVAMALQSRGIRINK